ncbi:MAG: hypothetical protein ACXAC7_15530 [Candidatus Hodarchaeales archaeon]
MNTQQKEKDAIKFLSGIKSILRIIEEGDEFSIPRVLEVLKEEGDIRVITDSKESILIQIIKSLPSYEYDNSKNSFRKKNSITKEEISSYFDNISYTDGEIKIAKSINKWDEYYKNLWFKIEKQLLIINGIKQEIILKQSKIKDNYKTKKTEFLDELQELEKKYNSKCLELLDGLMKKEYKNLQRMNPVDLDDPDLDENIDLIAVEWREYLSRMMKYNRIIERLEENSIISDKFKDRYLRKMS